MIIDTDDYVTLRDACRIAGFAQTTGYRLAKSLGIVKQFFGASIVKKTDIEAMQQSRKRVGNPDWIESYDAASEAAMRAVESRMTKRREREPAKREV